MTEAPRGVVTNGKDCVTTAHLNLTRTMADVWRSDMLAADRLEKNRDRRRAKRESHLPKARYAGGPV